MNRSDHTASGELLALVYDRLKQLAERQLAGERDGHTLQATALVHEAWLNLRDRLDVMRGEPGLFFVAAAEAMRRILIDHARRRGARKRGGGAARIPLDLVELAASASIDEVLELDGAIEALATTSPRSAEVVRLRFFAGLGEAQCAEVLGVSERTVRREWTYARAWLFKRLADDRPSER